MCVHERVSGKAALTLHPSSVISAITDYMPYSPSAHGFLATFLLLTIGACDNAPSQRPAAIEAPRTTTTTTAPVTPAPVGTDGAVKLNPAHGEPGHVCEIPVGAPLDGNAASTSAPAQIGRAHV